MYITRIALERVIHNHLLTIKRHESDNKTSYEYVVTRVKKEDYIPEITVNPLKAEVLIRQSGFRYYHTPEEARRDTESFMKAIETARKIQSIIDSYEDIGELINSKG